MSAKDPRCDNSEYWDSALGFCQHCAIPCRIDWDCKVLCPQYYEKYHGSGSTITPATMPDPPVTIDNQDITSVALVTGLACTLGIILVAVVVLYLRRKMRYTSIRLQHPDAEGNSGTIELLSDAQRNPDHTNNLPADERRLLETRTGIDVARVFCGLDTEHRSNTSSETHIGPTTGVTPPLNHTPGNDTSVTSHDNQASSNGTSVTSHDNQASANARPPTSVTSHDNQASLDGRPRSTSVTSHDNQASVNVGRPNRDTSPDHHENANPGVPTRRTSYDSQGVASSVPPVSVTPARNQGNGNTGPSANVHLHRVNQGTASDGPPSLGELAQNPAADPVVLPTSRPGDFGMSQVPTPMNPLSSLRESPGLIQNPVQATSEPPSDIPGSGIPSLHLQVYGAFPPEVADRWDDLSLHSDQEDNLNLVSDEEDLDPLSGNPGSLQLDLRSGLERPPQPQAAGNMYHWEEVEQMSGTGGVSTGAVLRGLERIEEHADHMPWFRGCRITCHKLKIDTNLGLMAKEEVRQKIIDITGLPRQALVLRHRYPAPGPGLYPPQESIDSLFGDSGPA